LLERLKGVTHWERGDIVAEIRDHIEDGLRDPRMGRSERQRLERIMSELGHPEEMADKMSKVHRYPRYMRPIMAIGAILVIISAFLPFGAFFAVLVHPAFFAVGGIAYPFHFWWFGCTLIIIGAGVLLLSIFRLSHRTALIHMVVGFLLSVIAAIAILLSFLRVLWLLPYAFAPMLVGGLILAIGGIRTVRRGQYRRYGYDKGRCSPYCHYQ
jgi:hypothetical protein